MRKLIKIYLFLFLSLTASAAHALTVDYYQDCESGSYAEILSTTIIKNSCYAPNAGNFAVYSTTPGAFKDMWVTTDNIKQLPGTVTVRGGSTYADTGTRNWASDDRFRNNFVGFRLGSGQGVLTTQFTFACHLTIGPTVYFNYGYDTVGVNGSGSVGPYTWACAVIQQINNAGGPYIRAHGNGTPQITPNIKVESGKTYWVNMRFDGAAKLLHLAAFDPDNNYSLVGGSVSIAVTNSLEYLTLICYGRTDAHADQLNDMNKTYFDNMMIDYTNAPYPLLPDLGPPDTSSPTAPGAVYDGATAGADISSTTSTTQLSANWAVAVDTESAITNYQYAIGNTPGGVNITGWTSAGLSVTKTGLSLTVGTTYYFSVRAVSSGGTGPAANSNGAVVISTASVDTSSPTAPGIVRDGATAGVDISSTLATTTLSANWTAGTDAESGITGYQYAIGTTAGGVNTAGWATLGNVLTVTRNSLTLVPGATYYFSVKAINGIGLTSPAANSNGQYVVAVDTGDTTPPQNISVVRDGLSSDVDSSTSLTQLSANWDSSVDAESGIARYWYAIGTQPSGAGASDTKPWTDNGQATSMLSTGLTLTQNVTYYISVKAENSVGLQSAIAATSNGQVVLIPAPADTTPPVISLVSAQSITANSAAIIWTTNEPSTALVEYGKLVNYDKATSLDTTLNTAHSVTIGNLLSGTLYHFRVISRDASGNEATSADYTFTTLSPAAPAGENVHAYPNPFKISGTSPMKFRISGAASAEVSIYTISGRLIKKQAGGDEISWDGRNTGGEKLGPGIYIYRITANTGDTVTGKFAVSK